MDTSWVDKFCLDMPFTTKDYQPVWDAYRYYVGGKMFMMRGKYKDNRPIITLKLEPEYGYLLREQYSDIIPGYYSNKEYWNSIFEDGNIPDDLLMDMLIKSYNLIYNSLTKKKRSELEQSLK